ncbi:MAG: response regulator [Myxococcaceae bacterium]|nr:response regulator [Myxococcaceae bacterium]
MLFHAERTGDGRVALLGFKVPERFLTAKALVDGAVDDVFELNRQVAKQKRELEQKHAELVETHQQLKDSNRGVLALHAELEDKSVSLRHNNELKSRLVANVSHEFRTPRHTILGLSKLLVSSPSEPLSEEQKKQVGFIRASAEELTAMVNDLLDLSKAEAGRLHLRPEKFTATHFVSSLRGMLTPLVPEGSKVSLSIAWPPEDVNFETDQGKLSQIVRNLVSNALKFTERGGVKVALRSKDELVHLTVEDTGIGIAPENIDVIFEEFTQIDSPLQRKVKGTGLGLSLSRKLAEILGGSLEVESTLGKGTKFTLAVPPVHPEVKELNSLKAKPLDPERAPVLVVEDDRKTIFIYEKYLAMAGLQVVPARTVDDARELLKTLRPSAIVLDVMLEGETTWQFLADLKRTPETADIPVLVVTVTNRAMKARALGADEFWLKPVDQDRLIRKLKSLSTTSKQAKVLIIDDDERSRYLMRQLLQGSPYQLGEASSGPEGVALAREQRPNVIFLDFLLKDITAFDVLDELKSDPRTRGIPVIIITSHVLDPDQKTRLAKETEAVVSKDMLSRELAINRIRDALKKAGGAFPIS